MVIASSNYLINLAYNLLDVTAEPGLDNTTIGLGVNKFLFGRNRNDALIGGIRNGTIDGGAGADRAGYRPLASVIALGPFGLANKGRSGSSLLASIKDIAVLNSPIYSLGAGGAILSTASSTAVNSNAGKASRYEKNPLLALITSQSKQVKGNSLTGLIDGDTANNYHAGGGGNDTINGSSGRDTMDGGSGLDTANYSSLGGIVSLGAFGLLNKGALGIDSLVGIETIVGSILPGDTVDLSAANSGGGIIVSDTNINLTTGLVTVNGTGAPLPLSFTVQQFENLIGSNHDDTITGNTTNNSLTGSAGNDTINGSSGRDTIDGGSDLDTANYSSLGGIVSLGAFGLLNKGALGIDSLLGIETIVGSILPGDTVDLSAANSGGGIIVSDTNINLTTGLVTVNGTGAPLPLSFTVQQFENIIGSNYDDAITGNTASNSLAGGAGNDVISGDDITSIANLIFAYNDKYYTLSNAGSWSQAQAQAQAASLAANLVTVNNAAENQFLVNTFGGTEALWIGFADEATEGVFEWANGEAVTYTNWAPGEPNNAGNEDYAEFNIGGAGKWNDRPDLGGLRRGIIEIDNSADTLVGGLGGDTLTGGLGNDVFKYTSVTESTASETNRDTITDFQLGLDKLDLGAIDANSLIALDQAFSFLGNSATFTNAGQLRYQVSGDNLLLFGNIDANFATSEFELQLSGLASIGASDIIL